MGVARNPPVTIARLRELLSYDPETGHLTWLRRTGRQGAGKPAGTVQTRRRGGTARPAYVVTAIDRHRVLVHRVAWALMTGSWPQLGWVIDHIDNVGTNNEWKNLRAITPRQNTARRGKYKADATSKHKGVSFISRHRDRHRPWLAQTAVNRRMVYIGQYATEDEARDAYNAFMSKVHAEVADDFAREDGKLVLT